MTAPCRNAALLLALALAPIAPPASAAESYDSCTNYIMSLPVTINSHGVWCLKGDLATSLSSGAAITVATDKVTIACNEFKVGGLGAGLGTNTYGVLIASRTDVEVRGCNIRGFAVGIYAYGGESHVIEDNRIEGSRKTGIAVHSLSSTVRRNTVSDTGGTTIADIRAIAGIWVEDRVEVLDNTVAGVVPASGGGSVTGIFSRDNVGGTITGNRVGGLVLGVGGLGTGIDERSDGVIVAGNYLAGPDRYLGSGVNCTYAGTTVVRNVVYGFLAATTPGCTAVDNALNAN